VWSPDFIVKNVTAAESIPGTPPFDADVQLTAPEENPVTNGEPQPESSQASTRLPKGKRTLSTHRRETWVAGIDIAFPS
jgi:hypothetical protein